MTRDDDIRLTEIKQEDLPQILSWRNQPQLRQYFREYRLLTMAQQQAWYDALQTDPITLMFSILYRGAICGVCGLCNIDWINRSAEVSLYVAHTYIDKVIAPEALVILQEYAFKTLGMNRLWAEVWDFDTPKGQLLLNSGFKSEVRRKEQHSHEGQWHDSIILGRIYNDELGGRSG